MTVVYRLEPTGRTEHEEGEVLLTQTCPTCGADWTKPRVALPPATAPAASTGARPAAPTTAPPASTPRAGP